MNSQKQEPKERSNMIAESKKIQNYIYRFSDEIGKGNFSKVYRGVNELTGEDVAIKTIQFESLTTSRLKQLLNTETVILKLLNHTNVIRCLEILSSFRNCYIVTQLCNTGDLETRMKKSGPFSDRQLYQTVLDIYEGLRYLGKKNIIHRDIKASNIFIHNNVCKIADFGFAQISEYQYLYCRTQFKDISVGSPIYMSPEGFIDNIYGPKTDVWALGVLLFELVEGHTPCSECRSEQQLRRNLMKQIQKSAFKSLISESYKEMVIRCLTVDHRERISIQQLEHCEWMKKARNGVAAHSNGDAKNYSTKLNQISNKTSTLLATKGNSPQHHGQSSFKTHGGHQGEAASSGANNRDSKMSKMLNILSKDAMLSGMARVDSTKNEQSKKERAKYSGNNVSLLNFRSMNNSSNKFRGTDPDEDTQEGLNNTAIQFKELQTRKRPANDSKEPRDTQKIQEKSQNNRQSLYSGTSPSSICFYSPKNVAQSRREFLKKMEKNPSGLLNKPNSTTAGSEESSNSKLLATKYNSSLKNNSEFNQRVWDQSEAITEAKLKNIFMKNSSNNFENVSKRDSTTLNTLSNTVFQKTAVKVNRMSCNTGSSMENDKNNRVDKINNGNFTGINNSMNGNLDSNNDAKMLEKKEPARRNKLYFLMKQQSSNGVKNSNLLKGKGHEIETTHPEYLKEKYGSPNHYRNKSPQTHSNGTQEKTAEILQPKDLNLLADRKRQSSSRNRKGEIGEGSNSIRESEILPEKQNVLDPYRKYFHEQRNAKVSRESEQMIKGETQIKILQRSLKFGDCIGLIHYCRLCYKLTSLLESTVDREAKDFFLEWSIGLLREIVVKISKGQVLYGNESTLMNNPSVGVEDGPQDKEKRKKLKDVTEEYLKKYTGSMRAGIGERLMSIKEARNSVYEIYLNKSKEYKERLRERESKEDSWVGCAKITYLSALEKETRALMEFSMEIRENFDGKAIEKLLMMKANEFCPKSVEGIFKGDA